MGFVKGMITGVLLVAGVAVGAAVVSVIKDEKKEKEKKIPAEENDSDKDDIEADRKSGQNNSFFGQQTGI